MIQYPSISEYEKNIKKLGGSVLNLPNSYEFIPNSTIPIKVYKIASGAFAGVFKIKEINTGKYYALRVFLNTAKPKKIERVIKISNYLNNVSKTWFCKTQFYDKGIRIEGKDYPVILMEWCDGIPLNNYVSSIISQDNLLSQLQSKIVELSNGLETEGIAHGDIQSGNVFVEKTSLGIELKLVDYDPMFIPTLTGEFAFELGHSSFQHPKRSKNDYDKTIDRFSFWAILTALEAIKFDKTLWNKDMQGGFNDEDNFLFKAKDLENPHSSPLISRLRGLRRDSVDYYLNELLSDNNSPKRKALTLFKEDISIHTVRKKEIKSSVIQSIKTIDTFTINSEPNGAKVFCGGKELGITPIELPVGDYHSKMIRLSKNEYSKVFLLSRSQKTYNLKLEKQIYIYETPEPLKETARPEPPKPSIQNNTPPESSNNVWIIIVIVFVIIIWLIIILSQ